MEKKNVLFVLDDQVVIAGALERMLNGVECPEFNLDVETASYPPREQAAEAMAEVIARKNYALVILPDTFPEPMTAAREAGAKVACFGARAVLGFDEYIDVGDLVMAGTSPKAYVQQLEREITRLLG